MMNNPSDHFEQGTYDPQDYWEERAKRYRPEDPYVTVCGYQADCLSNQLMEALQTEVFRKLTHNLELKGKHVLEVGCGIGRWAALLVKVQADYTGLDISETMAKIASERVPEGHFQIGSADKLPFPDESFDFVFTCTVLHHLPPRDQVVAAQEMVRVVKNGGYIAIIEGIRQPVNWFNMFAKEPMEWIELFQGTGLEVQAVFKHRHAKNFHLFDKFAHELDKTKIFFHNILIPVTFSLAVFCEKLLRSLQGYGHFVGIGLLFKKTDYQVSRRALT